MMNWNSIEIEPPDEDVEVMDAEGRIGIAIPAYFDFHVVNKEIVYCEPYFDGWMTPCGPDLLPIVGDPVKWRRFNKSKVKRSIFCQSFNNYRVIKTQVGYIVEQLFERNTPKGIFDNQWDTELFWSVPEYICESDEPTPGGLGRVMPPNKIYKTSEEATKVAHELLILNGMRP